MEQPNTESSNTDGTSSQDKALVQRLLMAAVAMTVLLVGFIFLVKFLLWIAAQ